MELTGTGAIPMPIKGYELLTELKKDDFYRYYRVDEKCLRWEDSIFGDFPIYKDEIVDSWELIPILDSGVWIIDKMPFPEPQEGTLLLCMYTNFYITFEAKNNKWKCKENLSGHHEVTHYNTPLAWQWISAPK